MLENEKDFICLFLVYIKYMQIDLTAKKLGTVQIIQTLFSLSYQETTLYLRRSDNVQ